MRYVFRGVFLLLASFLAVSTASATPYSALIESHARANGIPVELAQAVIRHESGFNARATGRAGEIGLMQIKLSTARGIGYRGTRQALYDPAVNIEWGMKYLGKARRLAGGSQCGMLSRYNGGLGTRRTIKSYCHQVAAHVGRPVKREQVATATAHARTKAKVHAPTATLAAKAPAKEHEGGSKLHDYLVAAE
jgi:soluble lytic murein transglycosylase-like protein